jgi:hypothetical protein
MWDEEIYFNSFKKKKTWSEVKNPRGLSFANEITSQDPDFDFTTYLVQFALLKSNNNDIPPKKISNSIFNTFSSSDITKYFLKLDNLHAKNPEIAFKILMLIIALDSYGFDQYAFAEVQDRMNHWLQDDALSTKRKIDLVTSLWANLEWVVHFKQNSLIPILMPMFLEQAKSDPEYIAEKFDIISNQKAKHYLFSLCEESPDDFLQFARNIHSYKPELLQKALSRCLFEGRKIQQLAVNGCKDYHYKPTEQHLRAVSKELFEMLPDVENLQYVCQQLIAESFPDEVWYPKLFDMLWDIETNKAALDSESIKNCFLVIMNSKETPEIFAEAESKIESWAFDFGRLYFEGDESQLTSNQLFWMDDTSKTGLIAAHARSLVKSVNDAMHPIYSYTRNLSLPVLSECKSVSSVIDAYWKMVDWLINKNVYIALHALLVGFETNDDFHTNTDFSSKIAVKSKDLFIKIFTEYMPQYVNETGMLLEHIINNSRSSDRDKKLGKLLEEIFPAFALVSAEVAQSAYQRAKENDGSHSISWRYQQQATIN